MIFGIAAGACVGLMHLLRQRRTEERVVLDVQLNGESGIEVRYWLNETGVSSPVIFITANDSDSIRAAAMESGCIAYLTKPFPAKSLLEPIQRIAAGLAA